MHVKLLRISKFQSLELGSEKTNIVYSEGLVRCLSFWREGSEAEINRWFGEYLEWEYRFLNSDRTLLSWLKSSSAGISSQGVCKSYLALSGSRVTQMSLAEKLVICSETRHSYSGGCIFESHTARGLREPIISSSRNYYRSTHIKYIHVMLKAPCSCRLTNPLLLYFCTEYSHRTIWKGHNWDCCLCMARQKIRVSRPWTKGCSICCGSKRLSLSSLSHLGWPTPRSMPIAYITWRYISLCLIPTNCFV